MVSLSFLSDAAISLSGIVLGWGCCLFVQLRLPNKAIPKNRPVAGFMFLSSFIARFEEM